MNKKSLDSTINNAPNEALRKALRELMYVHANPVFGSAKIIEHEVAAFNALQHIRFLSPQPDEYDLVTSLGITKSKARNLLYQKALRQRTAASPSDEEIRKVLTAGRIARDGSYFAIEIPDPLLMDYFRKRVRDLGYLSDGSFSGTVARLREDAVIDMVYALVPESQRKEVEAKLLESGISNGSLEAFLRASLGKIGTKIAGPTGEKQANEVCAFLKEIFLGKLPKKSLRPKIGGKEE
jgi:hypothetical protein